MSASVIDKLTWSGGRDSEGYREYKVKLLIRTTSPHDGPQIVMGASGLAAIGSYWTYGNDNDPWCFCTPELSVGRMHDKEGEPGTLWYVEQNFTNKPLRRCQSTNIDNPMDEPIKISGNWLRHSKEFYKDRNGVQIKTSAGQLFKGPEVEFDDPSSTVIIEVNTSGNLLYDCETYKNKVNDATLWGFPARCIKLSNVSWSRKTYGVCTYYFTTTYEFEVKLTTHDRKLHDYGDLCLSKDCIKELGFDTWSDFNAQTDIGGSTPQQWKEAWLSNPTQNVVQYQDANGQNAKCFLDGYGAPIDNMDLLTGGMDPVEITFERYDEANFLLLPGVPASL